MQLFTIPEPDIRFFKHLAAIHPCLENAVMDFGRIVLYIDFDLVSLAALDDALMA